jgi:glycosyltransferase involved in cell wall biosynthesis
VQLTALVERVEHVCCRYRLAAFQPYLQDAGHRLDLVPLPRRWRARFRAIHAIPHTDAVIVQRKMLHSWQLYLARKRAPFLLFDFDDALFLRDSYSAKGLYNPRRLKRFTTMVRAADAVIAGNTFLKEQAALLCGAERVHVVPTCVDTQRYVLAEHQRQGAEVQLVWIGSRSTMHGVTAMQPILQYVHQRWPRLYLKIICDRFPQLQSMPVLPCPWTEASEARELAAADIGISWMPDDLWSRGKCGLKVLQYMAAGLPVIANPVGVQADMVRHGQNGFLATTAEEWAEAIGKLANDPALRRHMGREGRRRVEADFSLRAGASRWLALLLDLQQRRNAA